MIVWKVMIGVEVELVGWKGRGAVRCSPHWVKIIVMVVVGVVVVVIVVMVII